MIREPEDFRPVILETPWAGDLQLHAHYLARCIKHAVSHGDSVLASHAIYAMTGALDDDDGRQRDLGINAGFTWRHLATASVFYTDLGWSAGMRRALEHARDIRDIDPSHLIEVRQIGPTVRINGQLGIVEPVHNSPQDGATWCRRNENKRG